MSKLEVENTSTEVADLDIVFSSDLAPLSNKRKCIRLLKRIFSIELAIAVHAFASGLHSVIRTNLMIEKTCRVNLNMTEAVCDNFQHCNFVKADFLLHKI